MKITDEIIIIDLEATCWEKDDNYQKQQSEIIEIGICKLNARTGEITKSKGILVNPKYSMISDFCTQLTSITPAMVEDDGVSLAEACKILVDEYHIGQFTWASYGAYDKNMITEQCARFGIVYPMSANHINVKVLFAETKNLKKGVGMAGALGMLNIPLEGTHHRGIDDAKNIAKILYRLIG